MENEKTEQKGKLDFIKNAKFKFGFWTIVYILFVIWIGSWWLFAFIPVIFDFYVSKKVNWTFWKKRDLKKKTKLIEWIDAIVFAVIAATIIRTFFIEAFTIPTSSMEKTLLVGDYLFVSKFNYGPRMPNTPLSFPFAHHTLPLTDYTKSYLDWIQAPFHRLAGLEHIKNDDIVVFNFPAGDTVVAQKQDQSYYSFMRGKAEELKMNDRMSGKSIKTDKQYENDARLWTKTNFTILVRPVDKRENYIKRCVGISGDTIQVRNGDVFINGKKQKELEYKQYKYEVTTSSRALNNKILSDLGISNEDQLHSEIVPNVNVYPLIYENVAKIKAYPNITSVNQQINVPGKYANYIFPHNENFKWNEDNFGPLWIPKKGVTIKLDVSNLPLYHRCIETYEGNKLVVKENKIYINDKEVTDYTFKMDYFFMMGDNRHNSADSRFWGFVPEDHVVGKALFIWWSIDPDKGFAGGGLRWERILNIINN